MLYSKSHFGIVVNNTTRTISIFDTDTLKALQHIPMNVDVIDAALTRDCSRVVVSSFVSKTMVQFNLCGQCAALVGSAVADTFLEDVAVTPDGRFALSVDGAAQNQDIVSYSLSDNAIVSTLPANAQAIAVSPKNNGLVLTAVDTAGSVHIYTVDCCGNLYDTEQEVAVGSGPINVDFSGDGNFAFTSNYGGGVSVLSTAFADKISLISTEGTNSSQSMAVSKDSTHLFVLGPQEVSIYAFDPVTGYLAFQRSFVHGLQISSFYGVDQIALDPSETKLFISATGEVAVFTTYGTKIGTVEEVSGPGGLVICRCMQEMHRNPGGMEWIR